MVQRDQRGQSNATVENIDVGAQPAFGRKQLLMLSLSFGKIKGRKPPLGKKGFQREQLQDGAGRERGAGGIVTEAVV